jgi:hypothetical protein
MRTIDWRSAIRTLLPGLAGTLAAGAVLGLPFGPRQVVHLGLLFPAIIFGVTLFCAPTLCIASSLLGNALEPARAASALSEGVASAGHALLGVLPVGLFLATTSASRDDGFLVLVPLVLTGIVVGVVRLAVALRPLWQERPVMKALLFGWTAMAMAMGLLLFGRCLPGGAL